MSAPNITIIEGLPKEQSTVSARDFTQEAKFNLYLVALNRAENQ